jgi:hypothetical protein
MTTLGDFYEKCGYKNVREEYNKEEDFTGFRYEKAMQR